MKSRCGTAGCTSRRPRPKSTSPCATARSLHPGNFRSFSFKKNEKNVLLRSFSLKIKRKERFFVSKSAETLPHKCIRTRPVCSNFLARFLREKHLVLLRETGPSVLSFERKTLGLRGKHLDSRSQCTSRAREKRDAGVPS